MKMKWLLRGGFVECTFDGTFAAAVSEAQKSANETRRNVHVAECDSYGAVKRNGLATVRYPDGV